MSGHWKALGGVVLVFLLGCLAGALGSSAFFIHRTTLFLQRGAPAYIEVLERRLTRGLNLDENQRAQIHDAFTQNLEHREDLQKQIQPQVQQLNLETFRQIKTILHPDQLEAFRQNLAEMHHRFGRGRMAPTGLETEEAGAPGNAGGATPPAAPPAPNP